MYLFYDWVTESVGMTELLLMRLWSPEHLDVIGSI